MLTATRRDRFSVFKRQVEYELFENRRPIGRIVYQDEEGFVEIDGRRYAIVSQEALNFFEQLVKSLFRLWKAKYAFKDEKGALVARAEKNAMDVFTLHYGGKDFDIRHKQSLSFERALEIREMGVRRAIGEIQRHGLLGAELRSSLPPSWDGALQAFVIWMFVFCMQNARAAND